MQIPGNRNVVVLPEAFDREALDGRYIKAELLFEGAENKQTGGEG